MSTRSDLVRSLSDKEYRSAFVESEAQNVLPFQIKAMREARGWTQRDLAKRLGVPQVSVSRYENPNYCKMTIPTLQRIAEAFDVALLVRFAAFSELVEWACSLSPDRLNTVSYGDDSKLHSLVRDPVGVSLESASLPVETSQYEAYMSVLVLDHKATRGPYRPVPHTSTTANTLSFPVGGTDDVGTRRSHAT